MNELRTHVPPRAAGPSGASPDPSGTPRAAAPSAWEIEVFFDGGCPLCMREIRMLQRLDRQGRIRFTDIEDPAFDPKSVGKDFRGLMEKIHGRLPDGTFVEGVEVFRRLYAAVGFRRLAKMSRLPGVAQALDASYALFAKNRLALTGRCIKDEGGVCTVARAS